MPEQEEADTQPIPGEPPSEHDPRPAEPDEPTEAPDVAPPLLLDAPAPPLLIADHATAADEPVEEPTLQAAEPEPPAVEPEVPAAEPEPPVVEPRRLSKAERESVDRQQRRFAACGRCGYFVADCRIYLGQETFHDAILASRDGWVRMEGDRRFHRLVMDAFGVQLDAAFDSFNGTCPECRRSFEVVNSDEGPTRVKIRV